MMWIRKNKTALEIVRQSCPQVPLGEMLSWPVLQLPEIFCEMLHQYVCSAERERLFLLRFQDVLFEAILCLCNYLGALQLLAQCIRLWTIVPIIVYASFYRVSSFLCGAKKLAWFAAMISVAYRLEKSWRSNTSLYLGYFLFFFFYSEDRRETASVSSSVSYFYLQGSMHLHSLFLGYVVHRLHNG